MRSPAFGPEPLPSDSFVPGEPPSTDHVLNSELFKWRRDMGKAANWPPPLRKSMKQFYEGVHFEPFGLLWFGLNAGPEVSPQPWVPKLEAINQFIQTSVLRV